MKIITKSFKNENEIESNTLNIKPITGEKNILLATEVLIQANNLSAITDANLNGYITARDLNEALREVQNNLNTLATSIHGLNK
jgi:hypothetical protein